MNIKDFSNKLLEKKEPNWNAMNDLLRHPRHFAAFRRLESLVLDILFNDPMSGSAWFHENKNQISIVAKMTIAQTLIILAYKNAQKKMETDERMRTRWQYEEENLLWEEIKELLEF